jgi:hypothetical protein
LVRRQDEVVFSHRSFQEYLTAQTFLKEIQFAHHDTIARSPLHPAIISFMIERREEIIKSEVVLVNWIGKTRLFASIKEPYLGGNAPLYCAVLTLPASPGKSSRR